MYLTDLTATLRKHGLTVVELSRAARRHHGPMDEIMTVTCHHTAGPRTGNTPSLAVVRDGRPGLDGPLAQLFLARNGVVYVVSLGLCWHAGVSQHRSEENPRAIGIEAENSGQPGDPWPAVQMEAYALLCAVLIDHYGLDVEDCKGHKETCKPKGRKADPSFDMDVHRRNVLAALAKVRAKQTPPLTKNPKPAVPQPVLTPVPEEDIMRIVQGPDGKVWAIYGLTRSYLENTTVLKEFAKFYKIDLAPGIPAVSQAFLDNFDRVS